MSENTGTEWLDPEKTPPIEGLTYHFCEVGDGVAFTGQFRDMKKELHASPIKQENRIGEFRSGSYGLTSYRGGKVRYAKVVSPQPAKQ